MPKQFQAAQVPYLKPSAFWPMPEEQSQDPSPAADGPLGQPTLTLTPPDHVVLPDNVVNRGLSVVFPYIKRQSGGSAISIKYISRWQMHEGGAGSRSMKEPKGYIGYGGKEIKFTAVLNDMMTRDPNGPSTHQTIQNLIYWTYMETKDALVDRPLNIHVLKLKKEIDPITRLKVMEDYWVRAKGGAKTTAEPGSSTVDYSYENWVESDVKKSDQGTAKQQLIGLDSPIPPLPLTFSFGAMLIAPCVIKSMRITITRYDSTGIRAAEIDIALQEILGTSVWNPKVSEATREIIVDVVFDNPDTGLIIVDKTDTGQMRVRENVSQKEFDEFNRNVLHLK